MSPEVQKIPSGFMSGVLIKSLDMWKSLYLVISFLSFYVSLLDILFLTLTCQLVNSLYFSTLELINGFKECEDWWDASIDNLRTFFNFVIQNISRIHEFPTRKAFPAIHTSFKLGESWPPPTSYWLNNNSTTNIFEIERVDFLNLYYILIFKLKLD